jgi:hypothetical protein
VVLWVTDDGSPTAIRADRVPLRDRVNGIVSTFAVDVWLEDTQKLVDVQIRTDNDVVH